MGDTTDEDDDEEITEIPKAMEMEETLTTGMINRIQEPAVVKDNGTFNIIEGVARKTHFGADDDSGMEMTLITVTETIGIETPTVKVIPIGVEDGIIIIGVKDIVIRAEEEDGIPICNVTIQGINNNPNSRTQIIIVHHVWDINTGTQSHISNTHTPNSNNNNNTNLKCHQLHLNKLQISVSCVTVKAITIINANLEAISWPVRKKPSIKAHHTAIKTVIMGNGHRVTTTPMTLMANLFSKGGSQCH